MGGGLPHQTQARRCTNTQLRWDGISRAPRAAGAFARGFGEILQEKKKKNGLKMMSRRRVGVVVLEGGGWAT